MTIPITAIATLAEGLFGMMGQAKQNALAGQQIVEARNARRDEMKLAKSARTDALGNTTHYVEGQGWVTDVVPIVKAILDAQSREQLATLKEDAPRARAASVRKDERSQKADTLAQALLDKKMIGNEKTEAEVQAEEILNAAKENRRGAPQALLAAAIRSGDPQTMVDAAIAARKAAPYTDSIIAAAKERGTQRYAGEKSTRDSLFYNELGQLLGIANGTDGANPYMADVNGSISAKNENALQVMLQALQSGNNGVQSAIGSYARNFQPVDISGMLSGVAKYLEPVDPKQQALADALYNSQLTDAQVKTAQNRKLLNAF